MKHRRRCIADDRTDDTPAGARPNGRPQRCSGGIEHRAGSARHGTCHNGATNVPHSAWGQRRWHWGKARSSHQHQLLHERARDRGAGGRLGPSSMPFWKPGHSSRWRQDATRSSYPNGPQLNKPVQTVGIPTPVQLLVGDRNTSTRREPARDRSSASSARLTRHRHRVGSPVTPTPDRFANRMWAPRPPIGRRCLGPRGRPREGYLGR